MSERRKLPIGLGLVLGLIPSFMSSAIVFNFVPQLANVVAPVVCDGELVIVPSFRNHSHEYLCRIAGAGSPRDITFVASALTWLLQWLVLSLLASWVLSRLGRKTSS